MSCARRRISIAPSHAVDLLGPVLDHHQVTLVPHHAAHVQPGRPGPVGEPPGVVDVAAAPWQADLHVDQHRADPAADRGIEGRVRVDRDGDLRRRPRSRPSRSVSRVSLASRRSSPRPGRHHPFDLARRRGAERGVARVGQAARQRGRLERLDVRPQRRSGPALAHRVDVAVERRQVDDEGRRADVQVVELRRPCRSIAGVCGSVGELMSEVCSAARDRRTTRQVRAGVVDRPTVTPPAAATWYRYVGGVSADAIVDPTRTSRLDLDFVRSQFPAFAEPSNVDQSFFENAGGSFACRQTIDALTALLHRHQGAAVRRVHGVGRGRRRDGPVAGTVGRGARRGDPRGRVRPVDVDEHLRAGPGVRGRRSVRTTS